MIQSKIKLTIPLCGLLLLSSCRTEELLHEAEQKEELSKKFITFTKKHVNDVIDYRKGFKKLALRYDSIHKIGMTGRAEIQQLQKKWKSNAKISQSEVNSVAYIDFNIRSQLIEEENGDKWAIFPKLKGEKVVDLVVALLSEEETILKYYLVDKNSVLYTENIALFDKIYQKRMYQDLDYVQYKICGEGGNPPCDIEDVVIVVPKPKKPIYGGIIYSGTPEGGDCTNWNQECIPPDINRGEGGGGGSIGNYPDLPDPPNNPCEKVSKIGKHEKTKELMNGLKDATKYNKEVGYVLESNGENITPHYIEGKEGEAGIYFSLSGKVDGFIHSHYTKLLSIFSVSDIFGLAQMYKKGNIRDMNNFVMGLVTDSGTQYMMVIEDSTKFANFANNLFSGNEIDIVAQNAYESIYQYVYNISQTNTPEANESAFVNYLQTTGSGLKLIKGDRNMDNWKVLESGSGSPIQKDCN